MHLISLLNIFGINDSSLESSQISITSFNSAKNKVSLGEFPNGQYLNNPSTNNIANERSLLKNIIEHLKSCS